MKPKRARLEPYAIFRNSSFEGWTVKYIVRNMWRMHGHMDFDDLKQEAIVVFLRIHDKYKDSIKGRANLMRLYQICLVNKFNDLAKLHGRWNEVHVQLSEDSPALDEIATCEWSPEILTKLRCAPAEIKRLMGCVDLLHQEHAYQRVGKRRETTDEHISRVIGLKKPARLKKMLRTALA